MAVDFAHWLTERINDHRPGTLLLEAPFFSARQPAAGGLLFGLRMVALSLSNGLKVAEVAPTAWQAWARKQGWAKIPGAGGHVHDSRYMRAYYESR